MESSSGCVQGSEMTIQVVFGNCKVPETPILGTCKRVLEERWMTSRYFRLLRKETGKTKVEGPPPPNTPDDWIFSFFPESF